MARAQLQAYGTVETVTADPATLVVMLYDGAVRFLHAARRALAAQDAAAFAESVSRAHAIVAELQASLDLEAGGELGENLHRLYAFMLRHLTEALVRKSAAHLDAVLRPLETLREAFREAVETSRQKGSS
jgi:flagellar protein FliS